MTKHLHISNQEGEKNYEKFHASLTNQPHDGRRKTFPAFATYLGLHPASEAYGNLEVYLKDHWNPPPVSRKPPHRMEKLMLLF